MLGFGPVSRGIRQVLLPSHVHDGLLRVRHVDPQRTRSIERRARSGPRRLLGFDAAGIQIRRDVIANTLVALHPQRVRSREDQASKRELRDRPHRLRSVGMRRKHGDGGANAEQQRMVVTEQASEDDCCREQPESPEARFPCVRPCRGKRHHVRKDFRITVADGCRSREDHRARESDSTSHSSDSSLGPNVTWAQADAITASGA